MTSTPPLDVGAVRPRALVVLVLSVLLVLLGVTGAGRATAAAPLADGFDRSVSGGWGAADAGGSWTTTVANRFAVSGGVGTISLTTDGRTQEAVLPGSDTVSDLAATVAVSRTPTGSGLYVLLSGRRIAGVGQYLAKLRFLPSGAIGVSLVRMDSRWAETALVRETTVPGVRGTAGQQVRVRLQVEGTSPTSIRAKVWSAGAAEPVGWTAAATDGAGAWQRAGAVGLAGYLSRSSAPLTLRVDDIAGALGAAEAAPDPPPPPPADTEPEEPDPGTGTDPTTPDGGTGTTPPDGGTGTTPPGEGTPPSAPPVSVGDRATASAGAAPLGSTAYPVPDDAIHVRPSGSDSAAGSADAPLRTLARAVAVARNGGTVVLHAGTYRETVTIPRGKRLTVQAAPGDEVWLDGSREVTGWASDGGDWRVDGWTAEFDHSPTYTRGARDGTAANWTFVDRAHPMAAHPDMVFVDGVAQVQVASRSAVVPGTFYVDDRGNRLYLGTDPAGRTVHASTLSIGLTISGAGSVVRGIGIQRYATPVPDKGALRSLAPDVTIENVVVRDNATQGVYVGGRDLGVRNVLRAVTVERSGMLGIESSYSDGLVVEGVRVTGNNVERFNRAPVSGGMKICSARNLTVRDSVFADNLGPGLWFDESVHGTTIAGNDLLRNAGHGLAYEISSQAVITDNLVAGNGDVGMKINNASRVDIWNNTVVGNAGRQLWVVQDSRVASNRSTPGHDPRQPLPDPTVTWLLGPVTLANNVIGGPTGANCILCVQDTALRRTPAQIGLTIDGNLYWRPAGNAPSWLVTWPTGSSSTRTYPTVVAFTEATGAESHGLEFTGVAVLDSGYRLTAEALGASAAVARPLPDWIAGLSGQTGGEARLGARLG